jgi:hypothetical protein
VLVVQHAGKVLTTSSANCEDDLTRRSTCASVGGNLRQKIEADPKASARAARYLCPPKRPPEGSRGTRSKYPMPLWLRFPVSAKMAP